MNLAFEIAPASLPPAQVNIAFGFFLSTFGGTDPITFKVVSGELPVGIYLGPEGHLSGTAQKEAYCLFRVRATDDDGLETERDFKLHVEPQPRPFPMKKVSDGPDPALDD